MKISEWVITAALAVPLTLMGQKVTSPNVMGSDKPTQGKLQSQHFLTVLANEDQSEIDLAHLALKKSSNAQVKEYARTKILAADPAMEEGAKKLSLENGAPAPGFPSGPDKAEFYYLSKLSGKDFDAAYMGYEDAKQREDLIVVENEAASDKNPQVKQFAQKEEKPVQEAADSAKTIAQSLMP
jgi:putative membrane protein